MFVIASNGFLNVSIKAFLKTFKELLENRLIKSDTKGVIRKIKNNSPRKIQLRNVLL